MADNEVILKAKLIDETADGARSIGKNVEKAVEDVVKKTGPKRGPDGRFLGAGASGGGGTSPAPSSGGGGISGPWGFPSVGGGSSAGGSSGGGGSAGGGGSPPLPEPRQRLSFLERTALEARSMAKEKRASGESALGRALRSPDGLVDFAMDKAGVGLQGMVVDQLGKQFATVAEKAVQVRDQLQKGEIDTKGMVNELAQGVPILGGFVKGFNAVRELVTGEAAEISRVNQESKLRNEYMDAYVKSMQSASALGRNIAEYNRGRRAEIGSIGLTGAPAERSAMEREYARRNFEITEKTKTLNSNPSEARKNALDEIAKAKALKEEYDKVAVPENAHLNDRKAALEKAGFTNSVEYKGVTARLAQMEAENAVQQKKVNDAGDRFTKVKTEEEGALISQSAFDAQEKDARMAELDRREKNRVANEERAAKLGTDSILAGSSATDMRNAGKLNDAKRAELATSIKSEQDAAFGEYKAKMDQVSVGKEGDAERLRLTQEYEDRKAAIEKRGKSDAVALEKQIGIEKAEIERSTKKAQLDETISGNVAKLREEGKSGDAELLVIAETAKRKKEEIDQRAKDDILTRGEEYRKDIEARAKAEKAAVDVGAKEDATRTERANKSNAYGVNRELFDSSLDALRFEARRGSGKAATEARKLEISAGFADRRKKLQDMLTDPNVSNDQRESARTVLGRLGEQEKQSLAGAFMSGDPSSRNASLAISGRLSGFNAKSAEENSSASLLAKALSENTKSNSAQAKRMDALIEELKKNPVLVSVAKGGK